MLFQGGATQNFGSGLGIFVGSGWNLENSMNDILPFHEKEEFFLLKNFANFHFPRRKEDTSASSALISMKIAAKVESFTR